MDARSLLPDNASNIDKLPAPPEVDAAELCAAVVIALVNELDTSPVARELLDADSKDWSN
jgi:hypothetical protein